MKTVILPNDEKTPKQGLEDAMATIGGVPIFFRTINMLKKQGLDDFIICDNSDSHDICEYLNSNGDKLRGISVKILRVSPSLKSGKILCLCQKKGLENAFFVAPNDAVMELDVKKMVSLHRKNAAAATACIAEEKADAYSLSEKSRLVNSGFYIFEPEVCEYVNENSNLDSELLVRLAENDELSVFLNTSPVRKYSSPIRKQNI